MKRTIISLLVILQFGLANSQTIDLTELNPGPSFFDARNGTIAKGDIDNDGDIDFLISGKNGNTLHTSLYTNDGSGNFTLVTGTPFPGLQFGDSEFADVDNDGDIDLLITGYNNSPVYFANLYLNNGSGVFSLASNTPFEPSAEGDFSFDDIDNDGDKDLMMVGYDAQGDGFAKLYSNNGLGTFTQLTTSTFTPAKSGSVTFIDYDNDGDKDLIIAGENNSGTSLTTLYANNGSGLFSVVTNANFLGKKQGDIGVADTDNDGDLDVIITGTSGSPFDNIDFYVNNGNGTFSLNGNNAFPPKLTLGNVEFADFDNDGDKDLLLTGFITGSGSMFVAHIFQNAGNNNFQLADTLEPAYLTDVAIADIDGDNDLDAVILGITNAATNTFKTRTYLNNLNTVGVIDFENANSFSVFPNPTSGRININFSYPNNVTYNIFNSAGLLVQSGKFKEISNQIYINQPNGLYFLNIQSESQSVTYKIELNR